MFCGGEPEQAATSEVGSCRAAHTNLTFFTSSSRGEPVNEAINKLLGL